MLSPLKNWLTLACERCCRTFEIDDAERLGCRCPECHLPIRPIVSLIQEAALEWADHQARIEAAAQRPETIQ